MPAGAKMLDLLVKGFPYYARRGQIFQNNESQKALNHVLMG